MPTQENGQRQEVSRELAEFSNTVFKSLHAVPEKTVDEALGNAKLELGVGLATAPLDVQQLEFENLVYKPAAGKIVAETTSGVRPHITPHYHKEGCDFVVFLTPTEVSLGNLNTDSTDVESWAKSVVMNPGDELRLDVAKVHTWRAVEVGESKFVFYCPDSHLYDHTEKNPDGDRYIVTGMPNGYPPNYLPLK